MAVNGGMAEGEEKRVSASVRQEPAEVVEERYAAAEHRDPKQERTCWAMASKLNSRKSRRRWCATEGTWCSFRISCPSLNTLVESLRLLARRWHSGSGNLGAGARIRPILG